MAERTGCPILLNLWSYVTREDLDDIIYPTYRRRGIQPPQLFSLSASRGHLSSLSIALQSISMPRPSAEKNHDLVFDPLLISRPSRASWGSRRIARPGLLDAKFWSSDGEVGIVVRGSAAAA